MWNWSVAVNIVLLLMLLIAVYTDMRWGKIFNKLTLPCMVIGFLLNGFHTGWGGLWLSLQGCGLALLITVALIILIGGGLGGGDIKLLAAIGALRGPQFVLYTSLFTALAGGIIALIYLLSRGILKHTVNNLAVNVLHRSAGISTDMAAGSRGGKMSYAIAIALGTAGAVWHLGL